MSAPRGSFVLLVFGFGIVVSTGGGTVGQAHAQAAAPNPSLLPGATATQSEPVPPSSLLWPTPLSPSQTAAQHQLGSPFAVKLAVDLPIVAASAAIGLVSEMVKGSLQGPWCGLLCDAQELNVLDRTVVGNYSPAARTASDALLGLNIALPLALDFVDVLVNKPADRFAGFGRDMLVLAEVVTVNAALVNVVKYAVRRPRPLAYDANVPLDERSDPDAALSFYSGHSAFSFSMATAYSYLFMKRHPGSKLVVPVWVLSESMAAVTAYLRVHAGKHFYTDIFTGALVGTALGILIPYLHLRVAPSLPNVPALAGLKLSIVPTVSTDGAGVLFSAY